MIYFYVIQKMVDSENITLDNSFIVLFVASNGVSLFEEGLISTFFHPHGRILVSLETTTEKSTIYFKTSI